MSPRRPRGLKPDEHVLWTTITRTIKPLKPRPLADEAPALLPESPEPHVLPAAAAVLVRTRPGPPPSPPAPAPLDRKLRQRIAKGHEPIMRRLDLHGFTQREAHDRLIAFLRVAQADGLKIVLVVTGKGARDAGRDPFVERGVLRRVVPQWLHAPEFRSLVVGFDAAHFGHGGEGALYVRLRRRRG